MVRYENTVVTVALLVSCLMIFTGCVPPPPAEGMGDNALPFPNNVNQDDIEIPLDLETTCETVDGIIDHPDDHYAVDGHCTLTLKFKAGAAHGPYRIRLEAYTPIKFQRLVGDEIVSGDSHSISWTTDFFSGAESIRTVPFTFYPADAPSKKTMNGLYGIKVCSEHLETGPERCTIAHVDRPDRTWQAVGADWRVGKKELAYYFAEQPPNESWLFIRLESPVDGFEPEMTVALQPGLRIMTAPADYKPYYVRTNVGEGSAEIIPFHLGQMYKGDQRIILMRLQHDGRTQGKLPVRVTVRSDTHNYWEDSTVLLATSRNADGSLVITQQDNPASQTGIAEPPLVTITPGVGLTTTPPDLTVTIVASSTPVVTPTVTTGTCGQRCGNHACTRCGNKQAPTNIAWTRQFVAPYSMHRFDAYTNHQQADVYSHLSLDQFLHWFLVHNPHVNRHKPVLYEGQTYNFPTVINTSPR